MAGNEWNSFERDRERAAIIGLALAQLRNEREVREGLYEELGETFPELGESLEVLARITDGSRISQRVLSLQLLAKIARNRGTGPFTEVPNELARFVRLSVEEGARLADLRARRAAEEVREVEDVERGESELADLATSPPPPAEPLIFEAGDEPNADELLAHEDDLSDPGDPIEAAPRRDAPPAGEPVGGPVLGDDDDPATQGFYDGLNASAATTSAQGTAWQAFSGPAQQTLQLTDAEMDLPVCSDDEVVTVSGKSAFRVITEFSSPKPANHFARWADARTWDTDCSLFYESVQTVEKDAIPADAEEYSELFLEVVRFSKSLTLETPLIFTRSVKAPHRYSLQFRLPKGVETDQIAVDSGRIVARFEKDAKPPATQLTAEKAIAFKAPAMKSWPTLSCDLMWMELSILAALGCVDKET